MNAKQLEAAKAIIFNDLDLNVDFSSAANPLEAQGWLKSERYPISTSRIGVMALAIKSLTVQVYAGMDVNRSKNTLWLCYDFKYEHTQGGSNGYEVKKSVEL